MEGKQDCVGFNASAVRGTAMALYGYLTWRRAAASLVEGASAGAPGGASRGRNAGAQSRAAPPLGPCQGGGYG